MQPALQEHNSGKRQRVSGRKSLHLSHSPLGPAIGLALQEMPQHALCGCSSDATLGALMLSFCHLAQLSPPQVPTWSSLGKALPCCHLLAMGRVLLAWGQG